MRKEGKLLDDIGGVDIIGTLGDIGELGYIEALGNYRRYRRLII